LRARRARGKKATRRPSHSLHLRPMPPVAPTTRIGADEEAGEESAAEVGQRAQSWRRTSDAAATAAAAATPGLLGSPKRSGRRRQWWQRLLMARSRGYSTVEVWGCRRKTNNRVVRCRRPQFSLSTSKQEARRILAQGGFFTVTVNVAFVFVFFANLCKVPDLATSPVPTVYPIPNRAGLVGALVSATPTNASELADH
jgi:hypothetical protein